MEALWKLEDKWKLSTREAVLLFVCTASLVVGLCAATALRKRVGKNRVVNQDSGSEEPSEAMWAEPEPAGWGPVKRVLMSSVRWSGASKWEERLSRSRSEGPTPLLVRDGRREAEVEWPSHNSVSPVWQRPILMGEKCELPRFSGLILYDERGRPLDHSDEGTTYHQEHSVVKTSLRDLL